MTESQALIINIETLKTLLTDSALWKDSTAITKVVIVAGSEATFGPSLLATRAAARTGTRDISLALPQELTAHAAVQFPEATIISLAGSSTGASLGGVDTTGLANSIHSGMVALQWGADPVNPLAELPNVPSRRVLVQRESSATAGATVLLLGVGQSDERPVQERTSELQQLATDGGTVVIDLRGETLVVAPDGRTYTNAPDEHNLAKAGGAAVLAGAVASLLAQGADAVEAAVLAVHLHAMATDAAAKEIGERSILGRDVAERLAGALRFAERSFGPRKEETRSGLRRSA